MKNNSDKLSVQKNTYYFTVKDKLVRVIFSENENAPTIENALVKIAIRKFG